MKNDDVDTLLSFQAYPEGARCLQDPEQALSSRWLCTNTQPPHTKKNPKKPTRIFPGSKLTSTCWTAQMEKFPRRLELRSLKGRRQKWESLECFRNSMPYFSFDWRWVNIPTSAILKISANFTPFLLSALWNFSLYSDVCITSCYLAAHPKLSAESMETDPSLFCLPSGGCAVF